MCILSDITERILWLFGNRDLLLDLRCCSSASFHCSVLKWNKWRAAGNCWNIRCCSWSGPWIQLSIFINVPKVNNHLQECGISQCLQLTWSCRGGVNAPIPANSRNNLSFGDICLFKKALLKTLSSPSRLLAPLCYLHFSTGTDFSTTVSWSWLGNWSRHLFLFYSKTKKVNIKSGFWVKSSYLVSSYSSNC